MVLVALTFYLFSFILVAAGVMVISARNPVHSVLFLILAFFNAAGLFVLIGAEFIAMILVVVYVGAVAVLFLFVVMMLDISFTELRQGFLQYLPIGGLVGIVLLAEILMIGGSWFIAPLAADFRSFPIPEIDQITNTHAIGRILYTDYIYLVLLEEPQEELSHGNPDRPPLYQNTLGWPQQLHMCLHLNIFDLNIVP